MINELNKKSAAFSAADDASSKDTHSYSFSLPFQSIQPSACEIKVKIVCLFTITSNRISIENEFWKNIHKNTNWKLRFKGKQIKNKIVNCNSNSYNLIDWLAKLSKMRASQSVCKATATSTYQWLSLFPLYHTFDLTWIFFRSKKATTKASQLLPLFQIPRLPPNKEGNWLWQGQQTSPTTNALQSISN